MTRIVCSGGMCKELINFLSDVENDAAIIFGENGAYTVCVMMSGLSDTSAARSVIREISAQIYEYMCP